MKVAITGASGFVGGALARALAAADVDIHALVRHTSERQRLADVPVTWHIGDITEPESLRPFLADADYVIHAAGLLGNAGIPEADYWRTNAEGTRNVLEAARHGRAQPRVLYISSAGVLGPVREDDVTPGEHAPLAPSNPYERSKAFGEIIARRFADEGLSVIIVRPEFIYGPGDLHVLGLFRTIQQQLFFYVGDGRNTCHPTYIDDATRGMMRCLRRGKPGGIYHITGPRPVTFRRLAETIARELGVPPPWLKFPVPLVWLGASLLETLNSVTGLPVPLSRTGVAFFSENRRSTFQKAHKELGYTPQVGLEEGVRHSVAWYRQQGLL